MFSFWSQMTRYNANVHGNELWLQRIIFAVPEEFVITEFDCVCFDFEKQNSAQPKVFSTYLG